MDPRKPRFFTISADFGGFRDPRPRPPNLGPLGTPGTPPETGPRRADSGGIRGPPGGPNEGVSRPLGRPQAAPEALGLRHMGPQNSHWSHDMCHKTPKPLIDLRNEHFGGRAHPVRVKKINCLDSLSRLNYTSLTCYTLLFRVFSVENH